MIHPSPVELGRRRRRVLVLGVVAVLFAGLVAAVALEHHSTPDPAVLAPIRVSASSTAPGYSARSVARSRSPESARGAWRSVAETSGAWIELELDTAREIGEVTLGRPLDDPGATEGVLSFGDGSDLQVRLPPGSPATVLPITPRTVDRVRFTVSAVGPGASAATLDEFRVDPPSNTGRTDGVAEAGPEVTATQGPDGAGAGDPRALVDGPGGGPARPGVLGEPGVGTDWVSTRPLGAWVQLSWARPRELTSISLAGQGSGTRLAAGTLIFSDGAELPVGGVLGDPTRPTTVAFMPRVTSSIRLRIDGVDGAGPLALSELRARGRETAPRTEDAATARGPLRPVDPCLPLAGVDLAATELVVICPLSGSVTPDLVTVQTATAPGYTQVSAVLWPADPGLPLGTVSRAAPDRGGRTQLLVDTTSAGAGPGTLAVTATGPGRVERTVGLQLYRPPLHSGSPSPSSRGADGRTLVYADEFRTPVSLSRTGADADYAAGKPTAAGAEDFGRAIFAAPGSGLETPEVVGGDHLHLAVRPTPAGYLDAAGRRHVGGLLASARTGGSGFSAQYGYFETRMAVPSGAGTWPAFWLLPSDNLVRPTPVVAEIDAMESYGHRPTHVCHSTHDYRGGGSDLGVARCGGRFGDDRAASQWHTYGVSVTPTANVFWVDGRVVATAPQVAGGGAPMFFLVDLALGGGWPVDLTSTRDRADLYVDYVRVYV